jgi:hypothetical protein
MAIDKYLNIVTSQYRDKPKFMGTVTIPLNYLDNLYNVIQQTNDEFDIDKATGYQLDILGEIIGRTRDLNFQPVNGESSIMNDDLYRLVLKCKILMNNWDGKIPSIYKMWQETITDIEFKLTDNQDMSMSVYLKGFITHIKQELIQNGYIVPKPSGVRINYVTVCESPFNVFTGMKVTCSNSSYINLIYEPVQEINFKNKVLGKVTSSQKSYIGMEQI